MSAGRPTSYRDEFADAVVEFLAEGYSLTAFAGKIGVDPDTTKEWSKVGGEYEKPEFSAAVKIGRAKAVHWWESRGRELALGETKGNPVSVIFGLKNRAKEEWSDKIVHANDTESPMPDNSGAVGKLADIIARLTIRQSAG